MRRRLLGSIVGGVILSILCVALCSKNAEAIPAFSRKYKTACMTCHAPFPRLTALGEAFRLNGYKIPKADEIYVKEEPVSLGAEPYKKVFPEAVWPSTIPGLPPISLHATGSVDMDVSGARNNRTDFDFPEDVELLAMGAFGDDISFFVGIDFASGGSDAEAWVMFENLFHNLLGDHRLNIKAGNVGSQEINLPNARSDNQITVEDYLYRTELDLDTQPGFEVNGLGQHWRYHFGIVDADTSNGQKDFYGVLSCKFGGLGYDGSGLVFEQGGITTTPSGYWRDDSVSFGAFGYRSHVGDKGDRFDRLGGDVLLKYKDISLGGGFIRGQDNSTDIDKNIWFAESIYFVYPWLIPYLRYESVDAKGTDAEDRARFIFGAAALIRANIKLTAEGRFHTKGEFAPEEAAAAAIVPAQAPEEGGLEGDRVILRLDFAF